MVKKKMTDYMPPCLRHFDMLFANHYFSHVIKNYLGVVLKHKYCSHSAIIFYAPRRNLRHIYGCFVTHRNVDVDNRLIKEHFFKGHRHGKSTYIYPNGAIWTDHWKNSYRHGKYIRIYANKKIEELRNYKNGALNGEVAQYWKNGNCKLISHYKNGLLRGEYRLFSKTGHELTRRMLK